MSCGMCVARAEYTLTAESGWGHNQEIERESAEEGGMYCTQIKFNGGNHTLNMHGWQHIFLSAP